MTEYPVLNALIFSGLGIAVFVAAFSIVSKLAPFDLWKQNGGEIIDLLFAGHVERGTTLVLVTHDAALARRCDRVVRLRSGRIEGEPTREVVKA